MDSVTAAAAARPNVCTFIVIGFPHDNLEDLSENLPFVRRLKQMGVVNLAVNYYSTLPGTEIFNSLYDSGRIKIDRDYFGHILHQCHLRPVVSYKDGLTPWNLFLWKFRLLFAFYSSKVGSGATGGLGNSLLHAVSVVFTKKHESKLQTAVRNGLISA
jgi:hypothetical protein